MRDADLMSPEELVALAFEKSKNQEQQKEEIPEEPIKEGFVKCDFYCVTFNNYEYAKHSPLVSEEEADELIAEFTPIKHLMFSRGTRFVCYKDALFKDGLWSDEEGAYITNVQQDWAEQYLENIREI